MSIIVHKDLPMPKRGVERVVKYPFGSLTAVGDSFVEYEVVDPAKVANRLTAAVGNYRRRALLAGEEAPKFSVRIFKHEGRDVVGVWRV